MADKNANARASFISPIDRSALAYHHSRVCRSARGLQQAELELRHVLPKQLQRQVKATAQKELKPRLKTCGIGPIKSI